MNPPGTMEKQQKINLIYGESTGGSGRVQGVYCRFES